MASPYDSLPISDAPTAPVVVPPGDRRFRDWYGGLVKRRNAMGMPLNPDPNDPAHQYDYRELFKSGWTPPPNWETPAGGAGHFPSRQKTDANPRAIVNGMDTKTGQKVAPDWYTGPADRAPITNPYADLPTTDEVTDYGRMYEGLAPGETTPYEQRATDALTAASRGLVHGLGQPFTSPALTPFLQKPPEERGFASKVEDISDIIGQFLPVNIALKGVRVGMEAVGLARRLAPFWGTIVENAGAGGLFRIAQAISDNPDGFAKMKRKDAALYLAQQAGLGMAQWGAFAGLIEGGTGLVQAALLNSTLRPSAESIWRQINQRGWDHQVDAELKAAGNDPEQIKAAIERFWPRLSGDKQAAIFRDPRYHDHAPAIPGYEGWKPGEPIKPTVPPAEPPLPPATVPSDATQTLSPAPVSAHPRAPTVSGRPIDQMPASVVRISEKGQSAATLGDVDKPHGLYTTPADVESPHTELGGPQAIFQVNPAANVLTLDASGFVRTNRGLAGESAGIAAVKTFLGEQEAQRLFGMDRKNLQEMLAARYPDVQWSRYNDQHEMLEAFGAFLAREAGHDAIWAFDRLKPEFSEYVGLTRNAFMEGVGEMKARPVIQHLHALATLQREGYLQDLKDVAQEVPGARYPHEAEGNAVKAPDALLDKIVARGKADITDALRMTIVVRKLEDAPAIRRALESRGYQIVTWTERRPFRDIAIKLKNGADDQLTKELLLKTPRVFELAQTLGHDIYEITDKILPRLVKTEGDTPLTRKIGTLLERAMARIYRPAYALDNEMTPAISTAAESSGGVSIPALTKSDVTALQGLSNSLREPASNISDSVLSRRLELADAVDRFVATHAPPSAPIVPQPIPEAAQEFVQPAAGGPPQPPGGSPPVAPPPTGGEGPPPGEEGLPRASTLAEVAEVARQRGPTPVPGTPGYEIPPGVSPHLPAAPPWQAQVRQSLKNMIGGFARIAMLDPRRWIAPGDQPGVNQAARRVAFGALGQRDFDAAMIFREWQERIAPIIRQLASRATDVDESGKPLSAANKERLLAEALAWHLDSRRNPAEVAAYVQDALRQAQASDDEVLKRLPAIVHRASRLSDEELALAGEMDAFDQVRGRLRQDTDVQEGILDFHVSHIWKALKSGAKPTPAAGLSERLRASSPFAQGRLISTFARGIAEGHAPQTLDIRLINQIENMDTAHVLMSRQIVKGLEDANVGRWMEPRDAPAGWRSLGDTPMFKKGTQRMFVPEDAYPVLRPFVEKGTPPIHPDLQKLQFFVKRLELSLSLFHDFHLVGMFALSHPVTFLETLPKSVFNLAENISRGNFDIYGSWEPVRRGLEYATKPTDVMQKMVADNLDPRTGAKYTPQEIMGMAWRGGLTDSSTKMIDAYHDLLSPEKRTFFERFQEYRDRSLWDKLWRGLKAYEAVEDGQRLLKAMEDSPNPRTGAKYTPQEIMEGVAAHYNKKYGGLNWDRMGTAQQTRLNMRALLFAPDWLLSNTMFTVDGFKGILDLRAGRDTVQSRLAVKDLTTLAVTWMTLTQAASLMMTGHTTWDNEPGHEFQLEIPQRGPRAQRQYLDVTTPAAFLTFAHLLAGGMAGARTGTGLGEQTVFTRADAAGKGLADRVKSLLAARLAYLPRVAQNYLSNASFGGRPLLPGSTLSERAATGAKNVVFQALPFTVQAGLRASPVGQYIPGGLPGGQISLTEAATQFAGVGTPSIGAVVDKITFDRGLTRLNKADFFRNLSNSERQEFLQQYRTGQFTGEIALKIRAAANRQQALQSSASQRETQMLERGQIQEAIRSMAQRGVSLPTIRTRILPFLLRNLGEGDKRLQQAMP